MIKFIKPTLELLSVRQELLSDKETMSYNDKWGGTIDFPKEQWEDWFTNWILNDSKDKFYRYLFETEKQCFVGEAAYHFSKSDNAYIVNIIVHSKFRGNGYGNEALKLLCACAKENEIEELCDTIALDNPSINLFLKNGFNEIFQNDEYIMVKKRL